MQMIDIFPRVALRERRGHVVTDLTPYADDPNIYISFTDLPKIGVNPQFEFTETPIGIYAYPLKFVWDQVVADTLPFASDRPYVQVLRAKGRIMDVSEYNDADFQRDLAKLKELYGSLVTPGDDFYVLTDQWSSGSFTRLKKLFDVTHQLAKLIATQRRKGNPAIIWNILLRNLGYDGFSDKPGKGTIHRNEPCSAVFLSMSAIQHVATLDNVRKIEGDTVEIDQLADLTRLMTTVPAKHNAYDLRLAAMLNTEWVDLLTYDHSTHFTLNWRTFWSDAETEWASFVKALLSRDYKNFAKLTEEVRLNSNLKDTAKFATDLVTIGGATARSLADAKLYADTLLGSDFQYHYVEFFEVSQTTAEADLVKQVLRVMLRFLPSDPDTALAALKRQLSAYWWRISALLPVENIIALR